jgi:hypothetical protein
MTSVEIHLTSEYTILLDADDLLLVRKYNWTLCFGARTVYARSIVRRHNIWMHRLIVKAPVNREVDHINKNGLDNRRVNLRLATHSQNQGNSRIRKDNFSGYKGVSWHKKTKKWIAQIGLGSGNRVYLGIFNDPWDAAQAYNDAALDHFGKFASFNMKREID